jgi:hypothetical protein
MKYYCTRRLASNAAQQSLEGVARVGRSDRAAVAGPSNSPLGVMKLPLEAMLASTLVVSGCFPYHLGMSLNETPDNRWRVP